VFSVIVNQLASFAVVAVLAHSIAPAEFGIVAACLLCVELSRGIMLAGLPEYLVKQRTWDQRIASTAFWLNIGIGVAFGIVLALAAAIVSEAGYAQFGEVLLSLCVIFLIDALSATPEALLRHELRFQALAFRQIASNLLGGVAAVVAVWSGAGLWAIVIQRYTAATAQAAIVYATTRWRPLIVFSMGEMRPALRFSLNLAGANLLGQLNLKVVDVIVGIVAGPAALAIYQIAGRGLNLVLRMTASPAQQVALSGLSRLDNVDQMRQAVLRMVALSGFVSFPLFVGLSAVSPEFVLVAFGPQWVDAITPMTLLVLMGGPATINFLVSPILTAVGRSRVLFYFSAFVVGFSAFVALATAPFGVSWVAGGILVRSLVAVVMSVLILQSAIQIAPHDLLKGLVSPLMASWFMIVVVSITRHAIPGHTGNVLALLILIAVGGIAYLGFLLLFCRQAMRNVVEELKVVTAVKPTG
jgi:PST family polysaccharide transporter